MKKNRVVIIIELIIIMILIILLIFSNIRLRNKELTKDEHYENITNKFINYTNIIRKNSNAYNRNPDKLRYFPIKVFEMFGFPIDEFVAYETGEKCDLMKSLAMIVGKKGNEEIIVYYFCGDDSNYEE